MLFAGLRVTILRIAGLPYTRPGALNSVPPSSHRHYQARPARTRTLSSPALLGSPTETSPAPLQQQKQHLVVHTTPTTYAQTSSYTARATSASRRSKTTDPALSPLPACAAGATPRPRPRFSALPRGSPTRAPPHAHADHGQGSGRVRRPSRPLAAPHHSRDDPRAPRLPARTCARARTRRRWRSNMLFPARAGPRTAHDAHGLCTHPARVQRGAARRSAADARPHHPSGGHAPFASFHQFLPARPHIVQLVLPNFVGVPPGAGEVPSTAVPALAALDASPELAVALAAGRPLSRVILRVASTLYDGLRPAALFAALGGSEQLKEPVLVLAPDVDARTRGRLLGALAKTGAELEVLELNLEGMSNEVRGFFSCMLL